MQIEYSTLPVGVKREYAVVKKEKGTVSYLADKTGEIQRFSRLLAESTCKVMTAGMYAFPVFVDWPTNNLPSKRPMSIFPPMMAVH